MKLHEKYADRGLSITAIHIKNRLDRKEIRRYVQKHKIPYAIGLDTTDSQRAAYGVRSIPHMFLVGRDGRIVWDGTQISSATERAIEESLAEAG